MLDTHGETPFSITASKRFIFLILQVLRVLEGGDLTVPLSSDPNTVGSRSAHFLGLNSQAQVERRINHARRLSH